MHSFLVTYDLRTPGRNDMALHAALKAVGRWWHYFATTWIVTTAAYDSADALYAALQPLLGPNDRVLVVPIHASDKLQGRLEQDAWRWLKAHLAP
jgi:hypothetical protein